MASLKEWLGRARIDGFTLALVAAVGVASVLPVSGIGAVVMDHVTDVAIAALFFLHGARLSREAIAEGMLHLRLHGIILASTFILFPLLALALTPVARAVLTPELYVGLLFLCALPSTVQSAIAFTSMAGGNVAAAVCAASLSSTLGVFITPAWMALLAGTEGTVHDPAGAIGSIVLHLLVPFVVGHLLRPWIGGWVERHRALLKVTDRTTILLVIYAAFSAAVTDGLWRTTPVPALLAVGLIASLLLAVVLTLTTFVARRLHTPLPDEIAIVFCGSKKSLATGIPMAKIMFAGGSLGAIVLPIMIYHQIQLVVCAVLASRYAQRCPGERSGEAVR